MALRKSFLPLLSLALAVHAGAQTFRGKITGIITDKSEAVLPGSQIKVTSSATGLTYTTAASTDGEFSFQDLPPGTYTVDVSAPHFQSARIEAVLVSAGAVYNLPVHMDIEQQSMQVEVSAAGLSLDTTTTTQTTIIPARTVQDIPLNGRDFTQLIALSPGFAGYPGGANGSVDGARANQVNWQIEGSDNNDQWWNIMAVNQGGVQSIAGVVLPLDAVEEFSLQTQAGPETGRNPGGTINLIIRSGTNQLHGSAYYYNRNEALAAKTPFAPVDAGKNKLRNQQFVGSVGGPIFRNKTFFFLTYEEQKFTIGNQSRSTEPSIAYQAAARQLLQSYNVAENSVSDALLANLWPANSLAGTAQPNNYFNPDAESGYSHNGLVKLDHSFNDKNRLSFRYFVGQGTQKAPIGRTSRTTTRSLLSTCRTTPLSITPSFRPTLPIRFSLASAISIRCFPTQATTSILWRWDWIRA